jgi:hypothetical protein
LSRYTDYSYCNFMHLFHPTKTLVTSLQASQRMSRRKQAARGELNAGGGDLGWTPSAARSAGQTGGDDVWRPSRDDRRDDRREDRRDDRKEDRRDDRKDGDPAPERRKRREWDR